MISDLIIGRLRNLEEEMAKGGGGLPSVEPGPARKYTAYSSTSSERGGVEMVP